MYTFIKELNHYSFNHEQKRFDFKKQVYENKLEYLNKIFNDKEFNLFNPVTYVTPSYHDEENEKNIVDVKNSYPVSIEEEKKQIEKRAKNLEFLSLMNKTFEYCRNNCLMPDSAMRNLGFIDSKRKECVTDCLNIRAENDSGLSNPSKKGYKTFVWLA